MSETRFNWDAYVDIASISDVGMRRASNQDNYCVTLAVNLARWQEVGHLFLVADGMGAHAAGELASEIAADQIPHLYSKYNEASAPEALKQAVTDANAEIHRKGQANEDFYNMGTTCSVMALLPQGALVAHVGDSRVYRLRENQLEQLTFDHSLVWEMKASGNLNSQDDVSNLVPKNVITRSLGPYANVKVDLEGPFPVQVGDVFMLCSDGLTGQVEDAELGPILSNLSPTEAARVLVDLSNLRGGPDNITAIIVKITGAPLATDGVNGSKPIRISGKKGQNKIQPLSWALFFGCLLAAVLFGLISQSWISAAVPGAIALCSLLWIFVQMSGSMSNGVALGSGQKFGKGPYTRTNCASGKQLITQLEKITGELQRAAIEEQWAVDWQKMKMLVEKASLSAKSGEQSMAIRCYARSISFLMEQLRQHSRRQASETGIDT